MPSYGKQTYKVSPKDKGTTLKVNSNINFSPKNVTVPQKDLLIFFRQLAVIIQSGVPLAQGLDLLTENTKNEKFASNASLYSGNKYAKPKSIPCILTSP